MLVEHVVNRNVSTVRADDDVLTAARRLLDTRCGVLPVVVEEERGARVIGLLRHRDAFVAAYGRADRPAAMRSEEHTSELQSQSNLVCRLLLEKKKQKSHCSI